MRKCYTAVFLLHVLNSTTPRTHRVAAHIITARQGRPHAPPTTRATQTRPVYPACTRQHTAPHTHTISRVESIIRCEHRRTPVARAPTQIHSWTPQTCHGSSTTCRHSQGVQTTQVPPKWSRGAREGGAARGAALAIVRAPCALTPVASPPSRGRSVPPCPSRSSPSLSTPPTHSPRRGGSCDRWGRRRRRGRPARARRGRTTTPTTTSTTAAPARAR